MTNAVILANSVNEWLTPIVEAGMQRIASKNTMTYMLSSIISPQHIMRSVHEYLSVPLLHKYISKVPDEFIPEFSLSIIDGMVETRLEQGALSVPFLNMSLNPDAFRSLKSICEKNFRTYGTKPEAKGVAVETGPEVPLRQRGIVEPEPEQ